MEQGRFAGKFPQNAAVSIMWYCHYTSYPAKKQESGHFSADKLHPPLHHLPNLNNITSPPHPSTHLSPQNPLYPTITIHTPTPQPTTPILNPSTKHQLHNYTTSHLYPLPSPPPPPPSPPPPSPPYPTPSPPPPPPTPPPHDIPIPSPPPPPPPPPPPL